MISKVISVEKLILSNNLSQQIAVRFQKIPFHKGSQYLLLEQQEHRKIVKIKYIEGALKLIEVSMDEYTDLKNHFNWLNHEYDRNLTNSEEYWAMGISFNWLENKNSTISEFKISNEKLLDILPYILQTGDGHVFFSE